MALPEACKVTALPAQLDALATPPTSPPAAAPLPPLTARALLFAAISCVKFN